MKKIIIGIFCLGALYAYADEVQPVVNITPDAEKITPDLEKPALVLPQPPAEIKVSDIKISEMMPEKATDTHITSTQVSDQAHKTVSIKKSFEQLSQEEQIKALKHKIDKLRKRSHQIRNNIKALEQQMVDLKKEINAVKIATIEQVEEIKGE